MSKILKNMKECILTKRIGFFVALPAVLLTLIQIFTYSLVSEVLFNPLVIVSSILGVLLFIGLSLFQVTSPLAPVALMVCNMLALFGFASAEGIVDVFSTLFFDGFALSKLFKLPVAEWFSIFSIVLTVIISSVAVYLPQNRKMESTNDKNEEVVR